MRSSWRNLPRTDQLSKIDFGDCLCFWQINCNWRLLFFSRSNRRFQFRLSVVKILESRHRHFWLKRWQNTKIIIFFDWIRCLTNTSSFWSEIVGQQFLCRMQTPSHSIRLVANNFEDFSNKFSSTSNFRWAKECCVQYLKPHSGVVLCVVWISTLGSHTLGQLCAFSVSHSRAVLSLLEVARLWMLPPLRQSCAFSVAPQLWT